MSKRAQSFFFLIIDDPKKRKQLMISLVVLIVIIIGVARYASQENTNAGEIVQSDNLVSQEQESSSVSAEPVLDTMPGEIIEVPAPTQPIAVFVDVGGAVVRAGVIALSPGSRITDAIEAAGGLTEYADISVINRAQIVADGDKIYIPTVSEVENGHIKPSVGLVTGTGSGAAVNGTVQGTPVHAGNAPGTDAQGRINLNTADSSTLQLLNGVGPATAQKIIDYRSAQGQFKRVEDIMNVSGIGQKTYERLKDEICV